MAKKIRFPLEMENGVQARTIEDIRDNFSIEKILVYYANGKLITWLRDRYLSSIADGIEALDKDDELFNKKICDLFGVEYVEQNINLDDIKAKDERLALLAQFTDDDRFKNVVDDIAFNQDEMYDLLDEGKTVIYLCGDKFSVPVDKSGIKYIGVNNPTISSRADEKIKYTNNNIAFEGVSWIESATARGEELFFKYKFKEAVSALKDAADEGNGRALYILSRIYFEGGGIFRDHDKHVEYCNKALESGDVLRCLEHDGDNASPKEVEIVKSMADENDLLAIGELGDYYCYNKRDNERDYEKAFELYSIGADKGSWYCQHMKAHCCCCGLGTEKNKNLAYELWKKTADLGHPGSMKYLYDMTRFITNSQYNLEEAKMWLAKYAETISAKDKINEIDKTINYLQEIKKELLDTYADEFDFGFNIDGFKEFRLESEAMNYAIGEINRAAARYNSVWNNLNLKPFQDLIERYRKQLRNTMWKVKLCDEYLGIFDDENEQSGDEIKNMLREDMAAIINNYGINRLDTDSLYSEISILSNGQSGFYRRYRVNGFPNYLFGRKIREKGHEFDNYMFNNSIIKSSYDDWIADLQEKKGKLQRGEKL